MSASKEVQPIWLDPKFWERLDRIETHHQRVQSEHELLRRGLDGSRGIQDIELQVAWQRYCEVIAELERTTAEFERLHSDHS